MFVITVKSKFITKKSKIILIYVCLIIFALVAFALAPAVSVPKDKAHIDGVLEYSTKVRSESEIQSFASQFGLEVDELYAQKIVIIPAEFNDTYIKYNELQKRHGLDLSHYKGKECSLCVYSLEDKDLYLSLLVHKGRVIGGHLSTGEEHGAMYSFLGE